jgi:hypothetical protein
MYMPKEITTIPIQKTTRETVEKLKGEKTWDDIVLAYAQSSKDNTKQILITVSTEKYTNLENFTKMLYGMKVIKNEKIEDTVLVAIESFIEGMKKQLQQSQSQVKPLAVN